MTDDEIDKLRTLAKSTQWEVEAHKVPPWDCVALTKATLLRLLSEVEQHRLHEDPDLVSYIIRGS
jgi:hypothetical protein